MDSVWLTDHLGRPLASSSAATPRADKADPDIQEIATRSVVAGQLQQQLRQRDGRWRLILAYPVFFEATASAEGALVGELDLAQLLKEPLSTIPPDYRGEVRSGAQVLSSTGKRLGSELSVSWPVQLRTRDNGASHAFTLQVFETTLHALQPVLWVGLTYGQIGRAHV